MDSPDILTSSNSHVTSDLDSDSMQNRTKSSEDLSVLQQQVIANFQKPNIPNVNLPEKIVICLDVCCDSSSLFRICDGTTFTPINMMKRVLDFFIHTKHAINKRTEFALLIMKDTEAVWVQNFTNNLKDIINAIDYLSVEASVAENFDLKKIFNILKQKIEVPDYKKGECITAPTHVVRMLVLYSRSNCIPLIPQEDQYFIFLKKQLFFYIDILLAHEEDCALYRCEEVFDALQDLDNGYSFVFEVSRNATKIHDNMAKLLAHPLQRPLQKNTHYAFGTKY